MEKEIVLYRTFDSSVEANIVKDVLETNGVPLFPVERDFLECAAADQFVGGGHPAQWSLPKNVDKADMILSSTTLPESKE